MSAAPNQAWAVSIELKDVASDRVERQRAAAEGELPLTGTPDLARLQERLADKGVKPGSPILLRVFKSESEFEVWFRKDDAYVLFATYPVCHWSGTIGPKLREGDKQTPEGFYTVTRAQMRHMGRWPRSLNLGFPNVFDKAQARSGSHILVHGGCSSVGCFAMTNSVIEEIYQFTEQAIAGGQTFVPVHVFPFRMTAQNLASQKDSPWHGFWENLKEGHDIVERTKRPPRVSVCEGRYRYQEIAPEEGSETGPLAPCGETLAALQALEQLSPDALNKLSLQKNPPALSQRPLNQSLLRKLPASALAAARLNPPLNSQQGRADPSGLSPAATVSLESQALTLATRQAACSMERVSCRRHIALVAKGIERRLAAAKPSSRQKTAARR